MTYFKKAHAEISLLEPFKAEGLVLIEKIETMLEDRHNLAHGYLIPRQSGMNHWTVYRHEFVGGGLGRTARRFSRKELAELERTVFKVMVQAADHMNAISREIERHYPKNTHG